MVKFFNLKVLNRNKPAFILFAGLLFSNITFAQADKEVVNVFDVYSKLGVVVGMDKLYTANEPNSVSYNLSTSKAFLIGLEYNFYQFKNYNLRVSALYRDFQVSNYQKFDREDTGLDFDLASTLTTGPWSHFRIPFEIQYFKPISESMFFYFGIGPEIIIYPDDPKSGLFFVILNDGTEIGYTKVGFNNEKSVYFGLNGAVGFGYKTRHILIKPFFNYHFNPKTHFTYIITTQNLQSSPNTISKHTIKGSYLSFGVILNPVKSLFK